MFVKRTGMRNMFKGISLFSSMNISGALIHSGWLGLIVREEQPGSNRVIHVILSCQFYVYLVRLSNAWPNGMAPALERKKNILYLVCG